MRLLAVLGGALLVALASCGGDDDDEASDGGAVVTPVGTKDVTPTPADTDGQAVAPDPVPPGLDEELTETGRGELVAVIEPVGRYDIDPLALAEGSGNSVPPCANFQFDFSWQVSDPYPPDGVVLSWLFNRQGGEVEVANGPAGNQAVGCGLLSAVNNGATQITVTIAWAVGGILG